MGTTTTPPTIPAIPPDVQAFITSLLSNVNVSTDVGRVADAVTEICKVLQTTQGQAAIQQWIANTNSFNATVKSGWDAVTTTIGGWFK